MKPYVVTEDVVLLMERWARQSGFVLPNVKFFLTLQDALIRSLHFSFEDVLFIRAHDMQRKMRELVDVSPNAFIISVDQIYNSTAFHLESNRIADAATLEILGEAQRPGSPTLVEQIRQLPKGQPITLVDDGCFSGDTLLRIYEMCKQERVVVANIVVGILIDRPNNHLVKAHQDVSLHAAYEFPSVIDWVCERDFFVGVPLSGRTVGRIQSDGTVEPLCPDVALPYCLPFGDPVKCASIPPKNAITFSQHCLRLSRALWEAVGEASGKQVLAHDIQRIPRGVTRDDTPFVTILDQAIEFLEVKSKKLHCSHRPFTKSSRK